MYPWIELGERRGGEGGVGSNPVIRGGVAAVGGRRRPSGSGDLIRPMDRCGPAAGGGAGERRSGVSDMGRPVK